MPGAITPRQAQNSIQGAVDESAGLTANQQSFAHRLTALTGLDYRVIASWLLAEQSGSAAAQRQAAGNNDWLNIGYTGSGTFGANDRIWANPVTAADATAGWLSGKSTVPGYGVASGSVRAILGTVGQSPDAQIQAIQKSGWAASGYPSLPSIFQTVSGANSPAANVANAPINAVNAVADLPGTLSGIWNSAVSDAKYAAVLVVVLIAAAVLFVHGIGASERLQKPVSV